MRINIADQKSTKTAGVLLTEVQGALELLQLSVKGQDFHPRRKNNLNVYVENRPAKADSAPAPSQALINELKSHVEHLSLTIGRRNLLNPGSLELTLAYIKKQWESFGFEVQNQDYYIQSDIFTNLWVEIEGTESPDEIVILGAHYDSFLDTPGADDNATAVAGLLCLSKVFAQSRPRRTLRFVAFANEEPPYFMSDEMGSLVYARSCRENGDNIAVMVCLEMLGYFSDEPGSQMVTRDLLPDVGNFITLCGNPESQQQVVKAGDAFHKAVPELPVTLVAVSEKLISEVAFSDHWSFWQFGWPAFMVTNTGPLRNPHYHLPSDLPETLDYQRFSLTVRGVEAVIREFAEVD